MRHARRSTLSQNLKLWLTAYLRAAHAYILISMPTGTSTIFGVFQAILALLLNRTNSAHAHKLVRNEKFASEIFCHKPPPFYAASQKELTALCGSLSNQSGINGFRVAPRNPDANPGPASPREFRIKNS
jgi:hypothetical protein